MWYGIIYAATEEVSVLLETSDASSIFLPNTVSMMQALNWNTKWKISVCLRVHSYYSTHVWCPSHLFVHEGVNKRIVYAGAL